MNNRSSIGVWVAMLVCAALIIGAMAWLTRSVMAAEAERSLAESRADLEERIRLSLWRMDTVAAALTIEENQRVISPEPTVLENPLIRLRFRIGADGNATPVGDPDVEALKELTPILASTQQFGSEFQMLCQAVHAGNDFWGANQDLAKNAKNPEGPRQSYGYQQELNVKERAVRGQVFNNAVSKAGLAQQVAVPEATAALEASTGAFQPAWVGGEPFLLRQVRSAGLLMSIEGVWIDVEAFRRTLLKEVEEDLLPHATLEPFVSENDRGAAMALASFPWRLVPGETAVANPSLRGPVQASLTVGWLAVVVALLAGFALVRGVMRLSERRASFVSAVTHELRTPLTTFRLYSDMLESGAVTDETKRSGYFRTLRREADRLSHLVENVLAFSRIERRSAKRELVELEAGPLLDGMRERFEERLAGAGMKLAIDCEPGTRLVGDATAIEHVLFNLIDNAAKYAAGSDPARIDLSAKQAGDQIELAVADHGPGIPARERNGVFRAFHKSAQAAAESQPGVGLGLALSRRLARGMHGELECRGGSDGAIFVLALPAAQEA
ncbi:sensor histidine kinase protein [Haloferula helveola]|uniref:histidine kinase n=1 Tax=Haloferula helveola TaxID=490095 RepID=A0ABM7R8C1_9BACT|nr:sensor histidine kinase protein [Haloferula helveola]